MCEAAEGRCTMIRPLTTDWSQWLHVVEENLTELRKFRVIWGWDSSNHRIRPPGWKQTTNNASTQISTNICAAAHHHLLISGNSLLKYYRVQNIEGSSTNVLSVYFTGLDQTLERRHVRVNLSAIPLKCEWNLVFALLYLLLSWSESMAKGGIHWHWMNVGV